MRVIHQIREREREICSNEAQLHINGLAIKIIEFGEMESHVRQMEFLPIQSDSFVCHMGKKVQWAVFFRRNQIPGGV